MKKITMVLALFALCALQFSPVYAKSELEYQEEILMLKLKNSQLEKKLEEVNATLAESASKMDALQAHVKQLTDAAEQRQGELASAQTAANQLKSQVEDLRKQQAAADVQHKEQQLAAALQRIQVLEKEVAAAQTEKTKPQQELTHTQAELQKQRDQVTSLQALVQTRETEVQKLQGEIASLKADLKEKTSIEAQLNQVQEQQKQLTAKDIEIARLKEEFRTLNDSMNSSAANLSTLSKAKNELEAHVTDLKLKNSELDARLAATTKELQAFETQVQQVSAARLESQTQLAELAKTKTGAEARLTKSLEDRATKIAALESEVRRLQFTLEEAQQKQHLAEQAAQNKQQTAEQKAAADAAAVKELEAKLLAQQSVPEAAKARIQELSDEIITIRTKVENDNRILQVEYPKLQQEMAACQEQSRVLDQEQTRCQVLESQVKEVNLALEQRKKELDAVAEVNLMLKDDLQKEVANRHVDDKTYNVAVSRYTDVEQQYAQSQKDIALKERVLQQTLTEKALLEKKLSQIESQTAKSQAVPSAIQPSSQTVQTSAGAASSLKQSETTGLTPPVIQPVLQAPAVSAAPASVNESLRALFPQNIFRLAQGATLAILGQSSDKTKIAYHEIAGQTQRLWIFNTRTRQALRILEWQVPANSSPTTSQLAWAHDQEHFLFSTGLPGKYGLYVGNAQGIIGQPSMINDDAIHFAWSPIQLQFAYFSGPTLFVQNLGDAAAMPIQVGQTARGAAGSSLQWSPDGTMLALSIKRDASFDIFVLAYSGGKPVLQTLVASASDDIQPAWSPDGRKIAFFVRSPQYDTKLAVIPTDRSRAPYVVAHQVSLPATGGPQWVSATELMYIGDDQIPAIQNAFHAVDITTGKRSSTPLSFLLAQ